MIGLSNSCSRAIQAFRHPNPFPIIRINELDSLKGNIPRVNLLPTDWPPPLGQALAVATSLPIVAPLHHLLAKLHQGISP